MVSGRPVAGLVRAFLLAFLIVGVVLMHTLGHHHDDRPLTPTQVTTSMYVAHSMVEMSVAPWAAAGHPTHDAGSSKKLPTDPAVVCMAVLMALVVLVGLRLLCHILWSRAPGGAGSATVRLAAVRASPWPFSLILTRAVVLRT